MVKTVEYTRLGKADLKGNIGQRVFLNFLARDVSVRLQKDKVTKFIVFNMVDKDIAVEARLFGANDAMIELIQEGKVYDAAVDVKPYEKSPDGFSCIIYNIDNSSVPPEQFADWAPNLDVCKQVIEAVLTEHIETIYFQITYPIVVKYWERLSTWSAAKSQHHTQLGGLLKHTTEVVQISGVLTDYFNSIYGENFIDKALVQCAAILHDVGKTLEYDVDTVSGKTDYSGHSILSTHIMDILSIVEVQAYKLGIGQPKNSDDTEEEQCDIKPRESIDSEAEALSLLKHCLAAHHGKLEYGSPIVASIPEAYVLHMADMMSAAMFKFDKVLRSIEPGEWTSSWTNGELTKYYKDSNKTDDIEV